LSKDLYLLRHAKSSWDDGVFDDRERGLNNRGRRDAPRMGRALAASMEPLTVHASPARRAQLTLGGLLDGWPGLRAVEHFTDEALYTFNAGDLADWIRLQGDDVNALFLIGHNPACTDLVNWICGEGVLANLPTAGFVHLRLSLASWKDLERGCGRLCTRLFPKEIDGD
jgi:phosphohistidine phosphatase